MTNADFLRIKQGLAKYYDDVFQAIQHTTAYLQLIDTLPTTQATEVYATRLKQKMAKSSNKQVMQLKSLVEKLKGTDSTSIKILSLHFHDTGYMLFTTNDLRLLGIYETGKSIPKIEKYWDSLRSKSLEVIPYYTISNGELSI